MDVWRHHRADETRLIIGYTARIPRDTALEVNDTEEIDSLVWTSLEDIRRKKIDVGTYKDFINRVGRL